MARRMLASILLLASILAAPVSALAFNNRITVYASVPELRAVYVNKQGFVYEVAGNTSRNIEPEIFDQNNQRLPMTGSIKTQYMAFMELHNWHLLPSKVYKLNPVTVIIQPDTQTVTIPASPSQLALTL